MTQKQKEHRNIAIVTLLIVHFFTSYIEGTLFPMEFSRGMRECEVIMIFLTQAVAHWAWINKDSLIKELRDEE